MQCLPGGQEMAEAVCIGRQISTEPRRLGPPSKAMAWRYDARPLISLSGPRIHMTLALPQDSRTAISKTGLAVAAIGSSGAEWHTTHCGSPGDSSTSQGPVLRTLRSNTRILRNAQWGKAARVLSRSRSRGALSRA